MICPLGSKQASARSFLLLPINLEMMNLEKVFKTSFNFGNVKALALNYNGAIRIKKINVRSSKVAGQSEVTAISQSNLDLAKIQFQESLK